MKGYPVHHAEGNIGAAFCRPYNRFRMREENVKVKAFDAIK
jgi:hypothetical protein